jgi:hypothetical protein
MSRVCRTCGSSIHRGTWPVGLGPWYRISHVVHEAEPALILSIVWYNSSADFQGTTRRDLSRRRIAFQMSRPRPVCFFDALSSTKRSWAHSKAIRSSNGAQGLPGVASAEGAGCGEAIGRQRKWPSSVHGRAIQYRCQIKQSTRLRGEEEYLLDVGVQCVYMCHLSQPAHLDEQHCGVVLDHQRNEQKRCRESRETRTQRLT